MNAGLSYLDLLLDKKLTSLGQDLANLKVSQAYSTGQIQSYAAKPIYIEAYDVTVPAYGGSPSRTVQEIAATFLFVGSFPEKTAVGTFDVQPTYTGSDITLRPVASFLGWMPTDNEHELRLGMVWRFTNYTGLNVSINTNMPGTFKLEKTYRVYLT